VDAGTARGLRFVTAAGRWLLAATALGSGMTQLDATVINVALPTIGRHTAARNSARRCLGNRHGRRRHRE
jgi:hypothetical protein